MMTDKLEALVKEGADIDAALSAAAGVTDNDNMLFARSKELGTAKAWVFLLAAEVRELRAKLAKAKRRIENAETVIDFYDGDENLVEHALNALADGEGRYQVDPIPSHYVDGARLTYIDKAGHFGRDRFRENGKWSDTHERM